MDFVDTTLVRLADAVLRASVLDEISLAQLVAASRDTDGLDVAAPYAPVFDTLRFFYADDRPAAFCGSWMTLGHADRTELNVQASGLGMPGPRIDALWAGAITATARPADSRVDQVTLAYLEVAGLDAEIAPLPTDPVQLEAKRRARLLARIQAKLDQPALFDDEALGGWLGELGVGSVGALMAGPQASAGATIRIHYTSPASVQPRAQSFRVAAALLIRALPISIAELLDETRRIRPYLDQLGFAPARDPDPRARRTPLVAWIVPGELFDDAGWPGAKAGVTADVARASRRMWAGAWLASEGIGLIVPPTN